MTRFCPEGEGDAPFAEADYVVVGVGSAGCVAGRLSGDRKATVILVESGKRIEVRASIFQ